MQVKYNNTNTRRVYETLMSVVRACCTILQISTRHLGGGGKVWSQEDTRLTTRCPMPWCFNSTAISNLFANIYYRIHKRANRKTI